MRKIIFILVFFSITSHVQSQKLNIEPGATLGTSYYLGDVNHYKQFYSPGLTFGLSFRQSFNNHYAVRLNLLRAKISGNDADFNNNYQQLRSHTFTNTIYEIGVQGEFNFLEFNSKIRKNASPYITLGLALAISNSFQNYSIAFPMGVGYKYSVNKKMTLSAEWVFRNTTTDNLDLLVPLDNFPKQITKNNTIDWYSIACITITYNFENEKKWCPAYSKKKK